MNLQKRNVQLQSGDWLCNAPGGQSSTGGCSKRYMAIRLSEKRTRMIWKASVLVPTVWVMLVFCNITPAIGVWHHHLQTVGRRDRVKRRASNSAVAEHAVLILCRQVWPNPVAEKA
eukprot:5975997-Amphidinium_carterae.1